MYNAHNHFVSKRYSRYCPIQLLILFCHFINHEAWMCIFLPLSYSRSHYFLKSIQHVIPQVSSLLRFAMSPSHGQFWSWRHCCPNRFHCFQITCPPPFLSGHCYCPWISHCRGPHHPPGICCENPRPDPPIWQRPSSVGGGEDAPRCGTPECWGVGEWSRVSLLSIRTHPVWMWSALTWLLLWQIWNKYPLSLHIMQAWLEGEGCWQPTHLWILKQPWEVKVLSCFLEHLEM